MQEHCLKLVIFMVGGQQPLAGPDLGTEGRIARIPRSGLDTTSRIPALSRPAAAAVAHPASEQKLFAVTRPCIRAGLQAMIDMHRAQLPSGTLTQPGQRMQQYGGIATTAQRDAQRRCRPESTDSGSAEYLQAGCSSADQHGISRTQLSRKLP